MFLDLKPTGRIFNAANYGPSRYARVRLLSYPFLVQFGACLYMDLTILKVSTKSHVSS